MQSDFAMRIVHVSTGQYVEWAPGQLVESNIVDELVDRVKGKGVGFMRSEAHVLADVRAAVLDLILDLKKKV